MFFLRRNTNKRVIPEDQESKLQAGPADISEHGKEEKQELAELDRIAKMLVRRDFELMGVKEQREKELEELKKTKQELEKAKDVLEIKVRARTKELEELTQSLEQQVKQRTEELQEKLAELESFNKMAVGRELKMVSLKEEAEKLKEELRKCKLGNKH